MARRAKLAEVVAVLFDNAELVGKVLQVYTPKLHVLIVKVQIHHECPEACAHVCTVTAVQQVEWREDCDSMLQELCSMNVLAAYDLQPTLHCISCLSKCKLAGKERSQRWCHNE